MSGLVGSPSVEFAIRQITPLLLHTRPSDIAGYVVVADKGSGFEMATNLASTAEQVAFLRSVADSLEVQQ